MGKTDIHLHIGLVSRETHTEVNTGKKQSYSSGMTPHPAVMVMSGVKDMLPHLKELGISRGILLAACEDESNTGSNKTVCQTAGMYPDIFRWMCNLDAKNPDTVKQRLAQYKAQGAVGIGEFAVNEWIGSPFIEAVFTAAESLDLPVLFHMSPEEGFNYGIADKPGLPLLEEALIRHPGLIFIGHSQPFWHEISGDAQSDTISRNRWGEGPVTPGGRLCTLMETYPNLYGDLSANSGGNAIMRDEEKGLEFLDKFQDKLMFGTDMCNTQMVFPFGGWLDRKLADGGLAKTVYDKICVENAERLFWNS